MVSVVMFTLDTGDVLGHIGRVLTGKWTSAQCLRHDTRVAGPITATNAQEIDSHVHACLGEHLDIFAGTQPRIKIRWKTVFTCSLCTSYPINKLLKKIIAYKVLTRVEFVNLG